jgi:D-glycero-D-manno-heptose 1,7-bisphosphate phosphatase
MATSMHNPAAKLRISGFGVYSDFEFRISDFGLRLSNSLAFSSRRFHAINAAHMRRAVFLDRDGTLIEEKNYLCDPAEVEIIPGTGHALNRMQSAGFLLIMITNQAGIGRGYYQQSDMERVNERVCGELARDGAVFARIYFAPEAPGQPSRGRKPLPQFLFDARDEFGINLDESYMIGDKLSDLDCGWNAGVKKSILVRTGYGAELERAAPQGQLERAIILDNLTAAADWILADIAS